MGGTRSMVRIGILLFALVLVGLVVGQAVAVEVTGAIQGTFVSTEGGPEPDVGVTLSGPNLQGSRQTSTDRHGFFQFLAVPPGPYHLHVSRLGLQPVDIEQVVVELGRTTAIPTLTLAAQPIPLEPVVVEAPRVTLDPAHTDVGDELRASDYASLPVDRDYKSIITILPHANESYRGDPVNVGGSTGLENQYYIDGVNVTDIRTGGRATSLPYNFVREVEVKTGGYEAQYGGALGGIVNAVTYSGTNDFEMSVFGYGQPSGLAMDPRLAAGVGAGRPANYDWGVRLGGPLVRDRLWYSAALNPRTDEIPTEISGFGTFTDRTEALRFATKLTWQANSATNVELSVFGDPTERDQVLPLWPGLSSPLNPEALLAREESGGTTASLRATVIPSSRLLLKASVGRQWERYRYGGATEKGRSESYWDFVEGVQGGGVREHVREDRGRTSVTAEGTILAGRHTIVVGGEFQDENLETYFLGTSVFRYQESFYVRDYQHFQGEFHNRNAAVYLQDSWRVTDRFTVNLGFRRGGQYLSDWADRTAQKMLGESQPRIGFSWQLDSLGTHRVLGSYARFYGTEPLLFASGTYVPYVMIDSYYHTDPREPGAVPDSGWGAEIDWNVPGPAGPVIDIYKMDHEDEFTLGYERLLGPGTKFSVRGMRRELRSAFGMAWSIDGNFPIGIYGEGDLAFLPRAKREYTALEISFERQQGRLEYRGSYVLSRNWGNYPGFYGTDMEMPQPGISFSLYNPYQATNSTGLLPNDRTHVVKVDGAYTTSFGVIVGAVVSCESGTPINAYGPAPNPYGTAGPVYLVPRGSVGRTPALWDLSLRFTYGRAFIRAQKVKMVLDLLHVGNPRRAVKVDEWRYRTLDEEGNLGPQNPQYRQPLAYQPPMAVRLGVEVAL